MALNGVLNRLLRLGCNANVVTRSHTATPRLPSHNTATLQLPSVQQRRWCGGAQPPPIPVLAPDIDYLELSTRVDDSNVFIVDVRMPEELHKLGMIRNSLHMHLYTLGHALVLPPERFLHTTGRTKPPAHATVVTVCAAGVRARTAQLAFMAAGYTDVRRYKGSMDDWLLQGGDVVPFEK